MPSPSSLFGPFLAAIAKLSTTNAQSVIGIQEITSPPYLAHPAPMILPDVSESSTSLYEHTESNLVASEPVLAEKPILFTKTPNVSIAVSSADSQKNKTGTQGKGKAKGKALQPLAKTNTVQQVQPVLPAQNAPIASMANNAINFQTKSGQFLNLISQYNAAREVLFDSYSQFQNNSAIAQYNVREISLSLLAAAQYAQKCAIYFEEITTDQTLTQDQINTLQKSFDAFKAQCERDSISYLVPRERQHFYEDQVNTAANIDDIVKILHLLQYVINGYAKIISSETGIYSTNVIIDYTGAGGTTIETGVIRFDINMFQDLIQFLHMFAHESGHLETMIFNQESTRTEAETQLSYAIPPILSQQFPNQQNEAEADINAAIVCALYDIPLSHPYTDFKSQISISPAQAAQASHPEGVKRAEIMQTASAILGHHFNDNCFGKNNIWKEFAKKIRSISGVNFATDIPTMAQLYRIYSLSPNDKAQQIRTLQAEYPNLFTNTSRKDYPPAPLVAKGIDTQLASKTNPSIPLQQIRRNNPNESIDDFQRKWLLAGGTLPFPAWVTSPPVTTTPVGAKTPAQTATTTAFPISKATPILPPLATVIPRPATIIQKGYGIPLATPATPQKRNKIPLAIPATVRAPIVKEQLFTFNCAERNGLNTSIFKRTTRRA